jgi:hypothetical protein
MLLHARARDMLSSGHQEPVDRWGEAGAGRLVAGGGSRVAVGGWLLAVAEIIRSIYIITCILLFVPPPRQDLTIPHSHDVDNCSLRFYKTGRQWNVGESRSPTQILQWNLMIAPH